MHAPRLADDVQVVDVSAGHRDRDPVADHVVERRRIDAGPCGRVRRGEPIQRARRAVRRDALHLLVPWLGGRLGGGVGEGPERDDHRVPLEPVAAGDVRE
jgi:hypothetical protein